MKNKKNEFSKWQNILEVLQHVYDITDKKTTAEHKITIFQQKNLFFVQFFIQFNTLLADFNWNSLVKIFFLKIKINYKLSQALIFIVTILKYDDYDK